MTTSLFSAALRIAAVLMLSTTLSGSFAVAAETSPRRPAMERIKELLANDDYRGVVRSYQGFDWKSAPTPAYVKLYCNALIGSRAKELPGITAMPSHVRSFARGYMALLSGRTETAIAIFREMQGGAETRQQIWGTLGLLEVGIYAENVLLMLEPLDRLKNASAPDFDEEVAYFSLEHAFRVGDFARASELFEKREWKDRKLDAAVIKAGLLLREGGGLGSLPAGTSADLTMKIMRAKYALMQSGPAAYQQELRRLQGEYPGNADIRLEQLSSELFSGGTDERRRAVAGLMKIFEETPYDFPISLYIANLVMEQGEHDDHLKVIRLVRSAEQPPVNFNRYALLEAKIYRGSRRYNDAREAVERALSMAPTSLEVLREGVSLFVDMGDLGAARKFILRSLDVRPHSPDIILALADLDVDLGNFQEARDLISRLKADSRFVDPRALQLVKSKLSAKDTK